jgi:hypothetical protein
MIIKRILMTAVVIVSAGVLGMARRPCQSHIRRRLFLVHGASF